MAQLAVRRREIAEALAEVVTLEFWNGGGSGSVEATAADGAVTEIAAGSGLLVPGIFDHYASFEPRPAAFFGLRVTRKPTPEMATVHGGGLIASGATGADRSPVPWAPPGLHLTGLEGAGEVQTPLTGHPAAQLADRRPGVVPPRQVGRALRARPRRAPRAWGGRHRGGAVLPRLRPCLLRSPPTPAPSPPRWPSACWPLPRRSARPPGVRRRSRRVRQDHVGRGRRERRSRGARRALRRAAAGVARAARPRPHDRGVPRAALARRGEPVDAVGLGGGRLGREPPRRGRRAPRARGHRLLVPRDRGPRRDAGVGRGGVGAAPAARDGARRRAHAAAVGAVAGRRGRAASPGSAPVRAPTWWSSPTERSPTGGTSRWWESWR